MELSVIIPAFNRERTIGPTIESVQACGSPAEIVVIDDGSKDRTVEVARGYGVTVLEQPNGGPSPARNNGFRNSTGDVVAFLDSDDVWLPGVVPDALRMLRDHPDIDVLFCETLFGNDADGYQELSDVTGRGRFSDLLGKCLEPDLFLLDRDRFVPAMLDRNQVFQGSALMRRTALPAPPFDPALFGGEDYELCLRLAASRRFAFLARPLARYEKHAGGLSANPDRMAREFALAIRSMANRPELFTPAEFAVVRTRHSELSFQYAYLAYDRGDFAEARRRFAAALRHAGFSAKCAAFWLACRLPGGVVRSLRRVKHGAAPS